MEEVLQKLLEAEVLSAETKQDLETAFNTKINEAISEAKTVTEAEVKADLAEQWFDERESLVEAIDVAVTKFLRTELAELREDINSFRDLEVEYAEKITEAKGEMRFELESDMVELVEKLDTFITINLEAELDVLKEDIEVQKQNQFGRKIFEAMSSEFALSHHSVADSALTLAETELKLEESELKLELYEDKIEDIIRSEKLLETLSPLSGKKREVMEAILKNVSTDQIQEGYNTFIGRVLKETNESITESKTFKKRNLSTEVEALGNDETKILENKISHSDSTLSESSLSRIKSVAGIY